MVVVVLLGEFYQDQRQHHQHRNPGKDEETHLASVSVSGWLLIIYAKSSNLGRGINICIPQQKPQYYKREKLESRSIYTLSSRLLYIYI